VGIDRGKCNEEASDNGIGKYCHEIKYAQVQQNVEENSRSDNGSDKELGSVGVFASVCHAQKSGTGVLQFEVLVWELVTVDFFTIISTCTAQYHPERTY